MEMKTLDDQIRDIIDDEIGREPGNYYLALRIIYYLKEQKLLACTPKRWWEFWK